MLAIIIPYYKLTFFRDTLESLAAQTDQRFHVYIGNDASPENPEALLKEYENKFSFTYKQFDENLGGTFLTKQWERCIDMMHHEKWLMILGDDDFLGKNVVKTFYQHEDFYLHKSNVIRFSTQLINGESQPISKIWVQPQLENALESNYRKQIGDNRSSLSEYIFKLTKYRKYGFRSFNLGWCADDFAAINFAENYPIYSINDDIVYVRISDYNITGRKDNLINKKKAMLESTKILLLDYSMMMSREQRIFYVKIYDGLVLGDEKVFIKDFFLLQFLTLRFVGFNMAINQWKSIIHKFLF